MRIYEIRDLCESVILGKNRDSFDSRLMRKYQKTKFETIAKVPNLISGSVLDNDSRTLFPLYAFISKKYDMTFGPSPEKFFSHFLKFPRIDVLDPL